MSAHFPVYGLIRLQFWSGAIKAKPVRAQLIHTHWIAMQRPGRDQFGSNIYDVNAGEWILYEDWKEHIEPLLLEHHKADSSWPRTCINVKKAR